MNTAKLIFDAVYPKMDKGMIEKLFAIAITNNTIEEVLNAINNNTHGIIEVNAEKLLELIKSENTNKVVVTGLHNNKIDVNYVNNTISVSCDEIIKGYYRTENDSSWNSHTETQSDEFKYYLEFTEYSNRYVSIDKYVQYVSRPVEE